MICPACDCGCLVLPYKCLYEKNSNLKKLEIEKKPEILNAVNSFVLIGDLSTGGLLGEDCFMQLCENIKESYAQAEQYRKDNPSSTNPETEFWFYLETKWYNLLKNGYFQSMYAAYCLYYYYNSGGATSETSADGDVIHTRTSTTNDGDGSQNINTSDADKKAATHLAYARKHAAMFKNLYLQKYISLYPCLDICGCKNINCTGCLIPNKDGTPKKKPRKPRATLL